MGLSLTSADLERFEAALTTLSSPLDFANVAAWQDACLQSVQALVGAHRGVFVLPLQDHELFFAPEVEPEAFEEYQKHWMNFDTGFIQERRRKRLEVCHWSSLYDLEALKSTAIYNGFSKQFGLLDCICVCNDVDEGYPFSPSIVLYHERETSRPFGERALTMLRLLLPAFRAGTSTAVRLGKHRDSLHSVLDLLPNPTLVCDFQGRVIHQNAALRAVVASDPRGPLLAHVMREMADGLIPRAAHAASRTHDFSPHSARSFRADDGDYLLRAALLGEGTSHLGRSIVVTASAQAPRMLTDEELRRRYLLTRKECRVARCLANRLENAEIAARLVISIHTSRRHTERVLAKLGVHSRAEVREKLCEK